MTSSKALAAMITNAVLGLVGLLVAFGFDISTAQQISIATFISAEVPIFSLAVAWMHSNRTKVAAAQKTAAAFIASSAVSAESTAVEKDALVAEVLA